MKKYIFRLFMLILLISAAIPAFTQEKIVDNAGLLSNSQKAALVNRINSISAKNNIDLVIVTEKNTGSISSMDYADDFFDYNGYGFGQNRDGCLFLQVTETRDFWISTSGRCIDILNNYALNKLETDIVKHLREGNNYEAYNSFLSNWEEFLMLDARWGRSYNFFYQWNSVLVIAAWVLAFAIGFITVGVWKSGMNTALSQTQAGAYIVPGSLSFKIKSDNFLYSTVTKTVRQTDNNSDTGGNRTHTGSSGRIHGGGGGRY